VLKVNRSELTMLAEQYKVTEDPMTNLKDQQASLSEAMTLQAEKSKQIAEQMQKTAEVYGEQDSRVKSLVTSYNESETALAKLQAKYQDATSIITDAEAALHNMADSQSEVASDTERFASVVETAKQQINDISAAAEAGGNSFSQNKKNISELNATYEELSKSIKTQKSNIDELTDNLKKAEKAYGTNSSETAEYREQLDKATKALDDMSAAADENREKVSELQKESESGFGGILSNLQSITSSLGIELPGGLDTILSKVGGLTTGVGGLASGVGIAVAAVSGYVSSVSSSAQSFSDMKEAAQLLGLDTTQYQKLEYALEKVGVSADGMTEIMNPLYSKIKETDEIVGAYAGHMEDLQYASEEEREEVVEAMNAWNEYGVALYDASGNLRSVDDIFYDLIEVYSQTTNQTERMTDMQELFGEAASKVNPIVESGGAMLRQYGEEAEATGAILSESLVNSMDNVNTMLDNFKSKWENVKNGLAATILSLFGLDNDVTSEYWNYTWSNFKGMFGYANGTKYAPGGWSIVGENGPEIVNLPRGSEVYPNGVTPRLGGGDENNYYNIQINASDVQEFNDIVRIVQEQRQTIRAGYVRG
jgi:phage-related tail protein